MDEISKNLQLRVGDAKLEVLERVFQGQIESASEVPLEATVRTLLLERVPDLHL